MVPTLMAAGTALFAPGPRMSAQSSTAWVTASLRGARFCRWRLLLPSQKRAVRTLPPDQKRSWEQSVFIRLRRAFRRLRFPEQEKRGGQRQAVEKTVPGHTSLLFTRPSCLYVDHIPLAFNGGSSLCRNMFRSALFYILRHLWDICSREERMDGGRGLKPPLRPAPSEAAVRFH